MNEYWYLSGRGKRFCWAKAPTFVCPHARTLWDYTDLSTGETTVVESKPDEAMGVTFKRHVPPEVREAAERLGMDPDLLGNAIRRAHSNNYGRLRVDGKLTDQCKACGHRMERLGFRCWIERPFTDAEKEEGLNRVSRALNNHLGFGEPWKTERSFYVATKAKAERWARREVELAKEAAHA